MGESKALIRKASSGDPKLIRELAKAKGVEGRDPALYPWAGDQWRRLHWTITVLDPNVQVEAHGKLVRHIQVREGFASRGAKGRMEVPRDGDGRRIPPVIKHIPWQEWVFITHSGGVPYPMSGWKANRMPATCVHLVPATVIAPAPPTPPTPPTPPRPTGPSPCPLVKDLRHDIMSCQTCLLHALAALKTEPEPTPPPPPPNAPHVPGKVSE